MKVTNSTREPGSTSVERGLGFVILALSLVGLLINFLQ